MSAPLPAVSTEEPQSLRSRFFSRGHALDAAPEASTALASLHHSACIVIDMGNYVLSECRNRAYTAEDAALPCIAGEHVRQILPEALVERAALFPPLDPASQVCPAPPPGQQHAAEAGVGIHCCVVKAFAQQHAAYASVGMLLYGQSICLAACSKGTSRHAAVWSKHLPSSMQQRHEPACCCMVKAFAQQHAAKARAGMLLCGQSICPAACSKGMSWHSLLCGQRNYPHHDQLALVRPSVVLHGVILSNSSCPTPGTCGVQRVLILCFTHNACIWMPYINELYALALTCVLHAAVTTASASQCMVIAADLHTQTAWRPNTTQQNVTRQTVHPPLPRPICLWCLGATRPLPANTHIVLCSSTCAVEWAAHSHWLPMLPSRGNQWFTFTI